MPTDVIMPQMGESIVEGTITKWLKKAGDRVEKDEPLFEISTDKVDAEIPSPAAGMLREIKVPEGATVGINTVVAVIDGKEPASAPPQAAPKGAVGHTSGDVAGGRWRECRDAADGRVHFRRHHHQMAQEGWRQGGEGRAAF